METTLELEIVPPASLEGVSEEQRGTLITSFQDHFIRLRVLIGDMPKDASPAQARQARLEARDIRLASAATHKSLKAESLRTGRAIDGIHNVLLGLAQPFEEAMERLEKAEELAAAAQKAATKREREDLARPYLSGVLALDLSELPEAVFVEWLADQKDLFELRQKRVEAERVAKLESDRLEKIRLEEERAKLEADRKKAEDDLAASRALAAKQKSEANAKLKLEREARERSEAQLKEARQREEAMLQQVAEEKAHAEEEARKAAAAPDAEKLYAFVAKVISSTAPHCDTDAGRAMSADLHRRLMQYGTWAVAQIEALNPLAPTV